MSRHNKEQEYVLRTSKKIRGIDVLGGKCSKCGETNILTLTFHHLDAYEKDNEMGILLNYKWSRIEKELKKCVVLCRNCHAETHNEAFEDKEVKLRLLKLKGRDTCEKCGHRGNSYASLEFHHINPSTKEFNLGRLNNNYVSDARLAKIMVEIEKCSLLCSNCHFVEHFGGGKFEQYKKEIYEKINSYVEKDIIKIDRNVVYDMRDSGMKMSEIADRMKCSRTTIGNILLNR